MREFYELGLWIANDLTENERKDRKMLLAYVSSLREQGREAKLRENGIIVKNKSYSLKDLLQKGEPSALAEDFDSELGDVEREEEDAAVVSQDKNGTPGKKRKLKQINAEVNIKPKRGRPTGSVKFTPTTDSKLLTQIFQSDKDCGTSSSVANKE